MVPLAGVADALYREELARARAMEPGEKLLEGARLFERACRVMADGIRHRHPDLSEAAVLEQLREHLTRLEAVDGL